MDLLVRKHMPKDTNLRMTMCGCCHAMPHCRSGVQYTCSFRRFQHWRVPEAPTRKESLGRCHVPCDHVSGDSGLGTRELAELGMIVIIIRCVAVSGDR